jgi:3-hydroxyisobutyrate dehydrogenase-like beta-hydroxyacid dehydrogenase
LEHAVKDARLIVTAAATADQRLPLASAVVEWFEAARRVGLANADYTAVLQLMTHRC